MKTVFQNSSQVFHVWAQQNQPSGRNGTANASFSGKECFSYAAMIGYINEDGAALLSSDSWSVTTSGHQSDVSGAVSHRARYFVPQLSELARYITMLNRGVRDKDASYCRAANEGITRYITQHALQLDNPSALYLARLVVGQKPGKDSALWDRIRGKANREKTIADDKSAKQKRDSLLADAKKAAALTPASFAQWKNATLSSYRPEFEADKMAKRLHHAHKAAKAKGWKVITKKTYAILLEVRAFAKFCRDAEYFIDRNHGLRENVRNVRNWLKPENFDRMGAHALDGVRSALTRIYENGKGLQPAQKERFVSFDSVLSEMISAKKWQERCKRDSESQVDDLDYRLRNAERERLDAQRRADWFAGVPASSWRGSDENGNAYMRVIGDELQTSQGASVPLRHAVRVFQFVKALREQWYLIDGKPGTSPEMTVVWRRNGHTVRVGHFTLDTVSADGSFVAGCHKFAWPEIERVAASINVADLPGDMGVQQETDDNR